MADEQYRWLDRETAERLLSGESLEAVDATARDQAERLAKTLDALSVESPPTSAELPGEAAALAAFRTARAERGGERADEPAALGDRTRGRSSDAGLVRIGGPDQDTPRRLRARAVRLGLAAALAVGMVGGVAVAAGTGALPTPFGDAEPEPGASVSAAVTPKQPYVSPSPRAPRSEPSPDGAAGGSSSGQGSGQGSGEDSSRDTARGGSAKPDDGTGPDAGKGRNGSRPWNGAASACRAVRDGEDLTADRRRALEGAAGGSSRVPKYCKGVLAGTGSADDLKGGGKGDKSGKDGKGDEGDRGDRGDNGKGNGNVGSHPHFGGSAANGRDGGERGGDDNTPPSAAHPKRAMTSPGPAPAPTYSAL
ncbi:hypothetical protein ABT063_16885 [Streptomyces sp. NPDC002838]|uniref:hypothetical protein n=1 Tax=Streptomyces sp. NPDC002838 TaxID=3154436 RepID=UPI00331871E2